MARRAAILCVLLACSCSGRAGTFVEGAGGAPPVAPLDGGGAAADAAVSDAAVDAPAEAEAGVDTACIDFCATALNIGCPEDQMNDCLAACDNTFKEFPACASQYDAENNCAAAQPKSSWYCDIDGFAALDKHYCQTQAAAYTSCRQTHYP